MDYIIISSCIYFLCSKGNSLGRTSITECFKLQEENRSGTLPNLHTVPCSNAIAHLLSLQKVGRLRTGVQDCVPACSFLLSPSHPLFT